MPFVKRTIEPIRIGLNGGAVTECRNELQQVTAISLVDVMRQLSSLSMHVQDMFGELHREAALIMERTLRLNEKVEYLRSEISQLNPIVEEVSLQDINLRKPFKFSSLKDQQIITFSTRPHCISAVYASCEPPPALQKLNSCRSDGKDSLKFYTDPGYFFELWCQAMQKESKTQLKKHKKSKKTSMISKVADDGQKWSLEKSKNKENISSKSVDQQKHSQKLSSTTHASDSDANKTLNGKQKIIPLRSSSAQKATKTETIIKPPEKAVETIEQPNKKVEHCAKECQAPEVKLPELQVSKVEPIVTEALKRNVSKPVDVITTSTFYAPSKQVDKFENCSGVLDLSNRNQNLYENTISLLSKENTYENALALLNEYNSLTNNENQEAKDETTHFAKSMDKSSANDEPVFIDMPKKIDTDDIKKSPQNSMEESPHENFTNDEQMVTSKADPITSNVESSLLSSHPGVNRSRILNLPPAPPTPPELYEGVKLNSDVCQLLEDVQKKTAAMKVAFRLGDDEEEEDGLELGVGELKSEVLESIEEALMKEVKNVADIDFSDLTDLPPIPSPPKFPPFMETSGVSSPTSFPSPPTPAYNQNHVHFDDNKEPLLTADIPNNNNNILETLPTKLGDETSVTSEMSAISSESESSVINSNTLNSESSAGVVRDTRCDLLAAIREGIQLRKVEECRQKIERKSKPSGRLDVQSIMEVAFEMRRKMLEEDDSEEDEEEFEANWTDED